jgi:hypothetical protein
MSVIYVGFGNSDDKLPQRKWAVFQIELKQAIHDAGCMILGEYHSYPDSIYQNACLAFSADDQDLIDTLKGTIKAIAIEYQQDAIAWNEVVHTEFLGPGDYVMEHPGSERWAGAAKDEQ